MQDNPLLQPWDTPYGLPPFDRIFPRHFEPAFEVALAAHLQEINAIAEQEAPPSFNNTLAALDGAAGLLTRIERVFYNLTSSEASPELQAVELKLAPRLAAHHSSVYLNSRLFARIDSLHRERQALGLDGEQLRLLERYHLDFVLAGAKLSPQDKARYGEIVEQLAELTTRFSQNVQADEAGFELILQSEEDLAGLPESLRAAARQAAQDRQRDGWVITLSRSLVMPFLTFSSRRDLRERAFEAWSQRGEHAGEHDNRPLASQILALRLEQAKLHGHVSFADYTLVDTMAGTPAAVYDLLYKVWEPAKQRAAAERQQLAEIAASEGQPTDIQPWDWRYYAEKVRIAKYDLDDEEVKPYFSLARMTEAMFDCANRLFGLRFVEKTGIPLYHPDVRLWEVLDRDQALIGIFLADNFARATKQGGAWMDEYRTQSKARGITLPIVVNNNNFAKGDGDTLLSFDDVRTLFHEFGHGLHGLLSNVRYTRLAGTAVLGDFVELPSQIFENWALEPCVLKQHARHVETGEPIPDALIDRLRAASQFNQGFETIEYTSSALVDLALHQQTDPSQLDITRFEQTQLAKLGMPDGIRMRHRLPHFGHVFGGDYYASRYYVYLWAEVLDTDGYDAFKEAGNPFAPDVAERLLRHIYSTGNSIDPRAAFKAFRGREPEVGPMLKARGLSN
ncbi:M3 family metallopeptidase [Parachitinimonas caeni]|uniref:M3 family metallopeptidase n=1 Tax=Parachitinimonas caeni TaxID=3031301 RepID=A0ABT7DY36_9NEIS|nr:M3 family metallopeptidase [Parachitinimonas caeni]MDK2124981.1 M3 family metallopeptidase [Parachitinimonas caeni]